MCDSPDAFRSTERRARKSHVCCECREEIKKGDYYQYSSGVWGGDPLDFKQCMNCHEIMDFAASFDGYDPPCFGDLREWFLGFACRGFTGLDWLIGMAKDIGISPEKLSKLLDVE